MKFVFILLGSFLSSAVFADSNNNLVINDFYGDKKIIISLDGKAIAGMASSEVFTPLLPIRVESIEKGWVRIIVDDERELFISLANTNLSEDIRQIVKK